MGHAMLTFKLTLTYDLDTTANKVKAITMITKTYARNQDDRSNGSGLRLKKTIHWCPYKEEGEEGEGEKGEPVQT